MSEMGDMVLKHKSPTGQWERMPNTGIPEPLINEEEAWRNRID